jgi:hypothetical protein
MKCKEKLGWIGGPLFRHYNGQLCTRSFFKRTQVYPLLHNHRNRGDPSLASYAGAPVSSIDAKFYYFGMYGLGAPLWVTMNCACCVRAVFKAETAEHTG